MAFSAETLTISNYKRWLVASTLAFQAFACADVHTGPSPAAKETLTYWQDIAPVFAEHCWQCHREGGIAPLRLDEYEQARKFAPLIVDVTQRRVMPPWAVTADGSCGEFRDSLALSDGEIERIANWAAAGAAEGVRAEILQPRAATLEPTYELRTPELVPRADGSALAEHDEYRCFLLEGLPDTPQTQTTFITGYEVVPGRPELVHHVIVEMVDPGAASDSGEGLSNGELMAQLDAQSPDRAGWPCFSGAGEGVTIEASPVTWAPGQGVVIYPDDSGVALPPGHKLVAQVHYNLVSSADRDLSDQTSLRLHTEPHVKNLGFFALLDEMLNSATTGTPVALPARRTSTSYTWTRTGEQIGIAADTELQIRGIMPHMHQLGRRYRMSIRDGGEPQLCAAEIKNWDFHWQRMYFPQDPLPLTAASTLSVTCDYDTSSASAPVLPGWGTQNEMCSAVLFLTVPLPED